MILYTRGFSWCIFCLCLISCKIIGQLIQNTTQRSIHKSHHRIQKDGSLTNLAALINNHSKSIFADWNNTVSPGQYAHFIKVLTPWIIAEPTVPISNRWPPKIVLQCNHSKYSNVFTGSHFKASIGRMIIDFVPFGYDLDKLELRLLEGFDIVDAYVLYEAEVLC